MKKLIVLLLIAMMLISMLTVIGCKKKVDAEPEAVDTLQAEDVPAVVDTVDTLAGEATPAVTP